MTNPTLLKTVTPAIDIYIKLAQFPILADKIRVRMREELFSRGIISKKEFYAQVKHLALESQRREGLRDPFGQEGADLWQRRKERIRDFHTDATFADNLGSTLLVQIIAEILQDQPAPTQSIELTFNPEIAPWELLFRQAEIYESLPPDKRQDIEHHLEEIKVVLIKRMISDQLPYIGVAKKIFSIDVLRRIYTRRIGGGKIGGKAAGLLLAWKSLQQPVTDPNDDISHTIEIPDSHFVGTEVIYEYRLMNGLDKFMNQKYRTLDEIREMYPIIVDAHLAGKFPTHIVKRLQDVLDEFGNSPLIVRSSSLLEDNFGFAFAGKYDSFFCPNQGTPEENLLDLLQAIKRVFASTLNPDALLYRQQHGLIDYDERMAVLIQRLRGKAYGRYFFPSLAGVGFSQNPFRWNPKIKRGDGFLRMVWGFGTRAVDRVSNDYPRLIALSHPQLRPETTAQAVRQYSQYYLDVIDLQNNKFETLPIQDVLDADFPDLRYIASINKGDYLQDILSLGTLATSDEYVLTFNYLTRNKKFVHLMRTALQRLEETYKTPVDVEFTVEIIPNYPYPDYKFHVLQCRPLSQREEDSVISIPDNIPDDKILFTAHKLIPDGKAEGVRYIVFVDPEKYRGASITTKHELGRAVSRLNRLLDGESFILMGPGRWGSANIELGVHVTYADIHNTKVLIEVGVALDGTMPELSYGTHFFQDLVEAGIYALPLYLGDENGRFRWDFFRQSPSCLATLSPQDANLGKYLRVIDVTAVSGPQYRLNILMDGSHDLAIGYLEKGNWKNNIEKQASLSTF